MVLLAVGCLSASTVAEAEPSVAAGEANQKGGMDKGLQDLTSKAMAGDPEAQNVLGSHYAAGTLVRRNEGIAFQWWLQAAESGHRDAQDSLADCYAHGKGVKQNFAEAVRWASKAAEAGSPISMFNMGMAYSRGEGVPKDVERMLSWFEKSASAGFLQAQVFLGSVYLTGQYGVGRDLEASARCLAMGAAQDDAYCLFMLGNDYYRGEGVPMNRAQGVRLWLRAAEQGNARAQLKMGCCYAEGGSVVKDYVEAYIWLKLAANQGNKSAAEIASDPVLPHLTKKQITAAKERIMAFTPRPPKPAVAPTAPKSGHGIATGTGFFITSDGYLVTNHHVVEGAKAIHVTIGSDKEIAAKVVVQDKKSDLAILKVSGDHPCLAIAPVRGVKLGATVATVGFPNIGVQGFSPKLAKGEIASLAGFQDDPGEFQISVPLQPGNSGGSLVDAHGNVVGVVCAIMNQNVALATTGTLANSVAYAVKSSLLINLVESVPGLADKLAVPATQLRPFEDVVADTEHATVLIMVSK